MRRFATLVLLAWVFVRCASAAAADAKASPAMPAASATAAKAAPPVSDDTADLAIRINIRAGEVRFQSKPETSVRFSGEPSRRTLFETKRQNLPKEIKPGVTYRNVGFQVRILSTLDKRAAVHAPAVGRLPKPPAKEARPSRAADAKAAPQHARAVSARLMK